MNAYYLAHHGIKGQKWGNRRWQNEDGSLTPEGYIHYGYGKKRRSFMTDNTKQIARETSKFGAAAGGILGAGVGASAAATLIGAGMAPAAAIAVGASYVASGALNMAVDSYIYGAMYGAFDTHRTRKYIEKFHGEELKEFEKQGL